VLNGEGKTVLEVYDMIGWNSYHTVAFLVCGFGWLADSIETGLLGSLKSEVPQQEWPDVQIWILTPIVFLGELIGCFIWGPLADKHGRRLSFTISNLLLVTTGVLAAFAPTYSTLVILRFLCGVSIAGITVAFDTLIESIPESKHTTVGLAIEVFWTGGVFFVPIVSAIVSNWESPPMMPWRILTLACSFPIFLACLGIFFLEESPLWLQAKGRDDEAMEVLKRMAKRGGVSLDGITIVSNPGPHEATMGDVIKQPYRRRTIDWSIIWCLGLAGYYGAYLATPTVFDNNGTENYTALIFTSGGELAGLIACVLAAKFIGNNRTMALSFGFGAVGIAVVMLESWSPKWLLAAALFVSRAGCMGGTAVMYVGTPLSYPTEMRATAHGVCNISGRMGGLLAGYLGMVGIAVQAAIFAACNLISMIVPILESKAIAPHVDEHNVGGSIISSKKRSQVGDA